MKFRFLSKHISLGYFSLFILLTLIFAGCLGTESETESGELFGMLVLEDGSPAVGATVKIQTSKPDLQKKALIKLSRSSGLPIAIKTDKNGKYRFKKVKFDVYDLFASLIVKKDTLGLYKYEIELDNPSIDLGRDTLKKLGSIQAKVFVDGKPKSEVRCYIPGKSFVAITDDNGTCLISNVPPETVDVAFLLPDYKTRTIRNVAVFPESTVTIQGVSLFLNESEAPPPPQNVKAVSFREQGIVKLTWEPVNVEDLDGYIVYRDTIGFSGETQLFPDQLIKDTFCIDTLFTLLLDTETKVYRYRVKSQDDNGDRSLFSNPFTIHVRAPNKPSKPSPDYNDTVATVSPFLTWTPIQADKNARVFYDVLLDTVNPPKASLSLRQKDTFFRVANLKYSTTYYWKILAYENNVKIGGPVWKFTIKAIPDSASPTPENVKAVSFREQGIVKITWEPAHMADLAGYIVYRDTIGFSGETQLFPDQLIKDTFCIDTLFTLLLDTETKVYRYRVKSQDNNGDRSLFSNPFTIHVRAPNKPSKPSPNYNDTVATVSPFLTWTPIQADKNARVFYDVLLDTVNPPKASLSRRQKDAFFRATNLKSNTKYYWKILAYENNVKIEGPVWKFNVKAIPDTAPPSPENFKVTYLKERGLVKLSWDSVKITDLDSFCIYRDSADETDSFQFTKIACTRKTEFTDTLIKSFKDTVSLEQAYRVITVDTSGKRSGFSKPRTVKIEITQSLIDSLQEALNKTRGFPKLADLWEGRAEFKILNGIKSPLDNNVHFYYPSFIKNKTGAGYSVIYNKVFSIGDSLVIETSLAETNDFITYFDKGAVVKQGNTVWNNKFRHYPDAISVNDTLYMTVTNISKDSTVPHSFGYLVSTDGEKWEERTTLPILYSYKPYWEVPKSKKWDASLTNSSLFYENGIWYCFYTAFGFVKYGILSTQIGLASGKTLESLVRSGNNPVLKCGPTGSWDMGLDKCSIIKEGNYYYMAFGTRLIKGMGDNVEHKTTTGLARSQNLSKGWTKLKEPILPVSPYHWGFNDPELIVHNGQVFIFFFLFEKITLGTGMAKLVWKL